MCVCVAGWVVVGPRGWGDKGLVGGAKPVSQPICTCACSTCTRISKGGVARAAGRPSSWPAVTSRRWCSAGLACEGSQPWRPHLNLYGEKLMTALVCPW